MRPSLGKLNYKTLMYRFEEEEYFWSTTITTQSIVSFDAFRILESSLNVQQEKTGFQEKNDCWRIQNNL